MLDANIDMSTNFTCSMSCSRAQMFVGPMKRGLTELLYEVNGFFERSRGLVTSNEAVVFTASASSRSFPGFGRFQGWTCHVYATSPADAVDLAAEPFDPENLPTSVKNAVMSKLIWSETNTAKYLPSKLMKHANDNCQGRGISYSKIRGFMRFTCEICGRSFRPSFKTYRNSL